MKNLFFLFLFSLSLFANDKTKVYFYSSETNINNFKSLKMEFDKYLLNFGDYEFQPFSSKETFENYIKDKKEYIVLLSSWHYDNISQKNLLESVLVGMKNGKTSTKRVLVTNSKIDDIKKIKNLKIASALSKEYTKEVLMEMLQDRELVDRIKIMIVPKDIDALMSVGFGMSKVALVTKTSIEKLNQLNTSLYKKIKKIKEGQESLLLIAATHKKFMENSKELIKAIEDMNINKDGKSIIKMFGLDGWQNIAIVKGSKK